VECPNSGQLSPAQPEMPSLHQRTQERCVPASPRFSPPSGCRAEPLSGSPVTAQGKPGSSKSVNSERPTHARPEGINRCMCKWWANACGTHPHPPSRVFAKALDDIVRQPFPSSKGGEMPFMPASHPPSVPIQRPPWRSSSRLRMRLLLSSGVLCAPNTTKHRPSNRASPLKVPSHR